MDSFLLMEVKNLEEKGKWVKGDEDGVSGLCVCVCVLT
jgi:hypothetical protein